DLGHPIPRLNAEGCACRPTEHVSSSGKFFARSPFFRYIVASRAPNRSLQMSHRRSRRPISPTLNSRKHPPGTSTAQIPIAELAAPPDGAYLRRFRALALFGRRPPERGVRSSFPASENLHRCSSKLGQQPRSTGL